MQVLERVPGLSNHSLPEPQTLLNLERPPKYQYQPLADNNCVRILTLAPGKPNDPLKGTLEVVNVDSAGSCEPISYVWAEPGPPNQRYEIFIRDRDGERLLELRGGSLFAALIQFRLTDRERRVWADQICINQDDVGERSQQVQFMNKIYKNASHVLVWLGLDTADEAKPAFSLVQQVGKKLQDEAEREKFHFQFTTDLERQSKDEWKVLNHLTNRSWFQRGWIVQEIGTKAPATIFWGDAEIDWVVLHSVCEKLTDYHHLRNKFDIRTSDIKFLFQRFIEPDALSYHANRFNFLYELHRARGLKFTDDRDRVFAYLGHYAFRSVQCFGREPMTIRAEYTKTVEQVYIDTAKWALKGTQDNSALIALAAVQHLSLPSRHAAENQTVLELPAFDKKRLPSWVPDWRTYQGFVLSEPTNPHRAHGDSKPKLEISEDDLVLRIHGLEVDTIEVCSRPLVNKEFHERRDKEGSESTVTYLWRDICQKDSFNLSDSYLDGQKAFFAFMQTLSNGCFQVAGREGKPYHEIPEFRWLEQAAMYLVRAMGTSDTIAPDLLEIAKKAEDRHVKEVWSRSANGASKNRRFAKTRKGYYVLGPAVMEVDDVVCVLFGGKLPFCLRPMGDRYILVGECYTHELMKGEALGMMNRYELTEKVFELV